MAAKHARHDMREDKNFKGTDPSETTAQYLYCDMAYACVVKSRVVLFYRSSSGFYYFIVQVLVLVVHGVCHLDFGGGNPHVNICVQ